MCNSIGIIDSSYRGPLKVRFALTMPHNMSTIYKVGDKVAQLLIVPCIVPKLLEVDELPESKRGVGAFGSSDQKST